VSNNKELTNLVEAHWDYIKKLLIAHRTEGEMITLVEFHYKSAFTHGYKHGIESMLEGLKEPFLPENFETVDRYRVPNSTILAKKNYFKPGDIENELASSEG